MVFHRGRVLLLYLEEGLLLLLNEVGDGGDGFGSHGSLLDVGVVGEHLAEEALLIEGFDGLDYLAFGVVALLYQVAEEQAH
jgi:hypothetical protein